MADSAPAGPVLAVEREEPLSSEDLVLEERARWRARVVVSTVGNPVGELVSRHRLRIRQALIDNAAVPKELQYPPAMILEFVDELVAELRGELGRKLEEVTAQRDAARARALELSAAIKVAQLRRAP
jgi:hypothetical protein